MFFMYAPFLIIFYIENLVLSRKKLVNMKISNDAQKKFGERLKMLREKLGISQEILSKSIGVSINTIQNYEAGQFPKGGYVIGLADKLRCTTDYLLTGVESAHIPGVGNMVSEFPEPPALPARVNEAILYKVLLGMEVHLGDVRLSAEKRAKLACLLYEYFSEKEQEADYDGIIKKFISIAV